MRALVAAVCGLLLLASCATRKSAADASSDNVVGPFVHFPLGWMLQSSVRLQGKDGHGSGVLIAPGYILTAAHVADDAKGPLQAIWADGTTLDTALQAEWKDQDVALLRLAKPSQARPSQLACRPGKWGEGVAAVGNPLGVRNAIMAGVVLSTEEHDGGIALNLPAVSGMSGGGVFDSRGNVIGIADAMLMLPETDGLYRPDGTQVPAVLYAPSGISLMIPATMFCAEVKKAAGLPA